MTSDKMTPTQSLSTQELLNLMLEQNIYIADIAPLGWVNAKETLPDLNTPVLVVHTGEYPKGFNNMQVCYLRDTGFDDEPELDWANSDSSFEFESITHWMPLPELPIK